MNLKPQLADNFSLAWISTLWPLYIIVHHTAIKNIGIDVIYEHG